MANNSTNPCIQHECRKCLIHNVYRTKTSNCMLSTGTPYIRVAQLSCRQPVWSNSEGRHAWM